MNITQDKIQKLIEVIDAGLCHGLGKPQPGNMCVEAAVCYALGEDFGDEPTCVDSAIRTYLIKLNEADWSTEAARANGLRKSAILQLGTNKDFDRSAFLEKLATRTVNILIADLPGLPEEIRKQCSVSSTLEEAGNAARAARAAANAADDAYDAYAARAAARGAYAAARAADDADDADDAYDAYDAHVADAAADAAAAAAYAANAAAYYAAYAANAAAAAYAATARDGILLKAIKMLEDILIEMNVPGVEWLPLLGEEQG